MIRKFIIVMLTLGAVGMIAIWVLSAYGNICAGLDFGQRPQSLQVHSAYGRAAIHLRLITDSDAIRDFDGRRLDQARFGYRDEVMRYQFGMTNVNVRYMTAHAPCWALILLVVAYPAIALARAHRIPSLQGQHLSTVVHSAIVATLTLATLATAVPYILSFLGSARYTFYFGKTQESVGFICRDGVAHVHLDLYAKPDQTYGSQIPGGTGLQIVEPVFGYQNYMRDVHYGDTVVRKHLRRAHAPGWIVVLLFGMYPVFALIRYRRSSTPGHCTKCRYNLTGNESGVCPECGTEIEADSKAKLN